MYQQYQQQPNPPSAPSQQQMGQQPINIPIIHEVNRGPSPSRGSPHPDFSQAIPLSAQMPQQRPQEPKPDYESPPRPSFQPQPQQQSVPPTHHDSDVVAQQPPKSQEERAFEIINGVMSAVKSLEGEVNSFQGIKKDKQYRYIEEMLTRNLLKLDSVDAGDLENVRQARRQAVRYIEAAIDLLELKAVAAETYNPQETAENPSSSSANANNSSVGQSQEQIPFERDSSSVREMQLDSEVAC